MTMRTKHFFLAACTMMLCAVASAADVVVDGITYSLNTETREASLIKGAKRDTVIIPDSIEYEGVQYAVTEVGSSAFRRIDVKHIVIGREVKTLKSGAFSQATSLEEIDVPDNVTEMLLGNTFYKCSALKKARIGRGVKVIGNSAFSGCSSLKEVILSEGLTTIGQNTFYRCINLREINIPSTVGEIQYEAFVGCDSLEKVDFASVECLCGIKYGNLNARPQPQSGRLYVNGKEVTELVVPEGVTSIGRFAFYDCPYIITLSLPSTLREIGSLAFTKCTGINSVVLPEGLTTIGERAFQGTSSLREIYFPSTLETMGEKCFMPLYGDSSSLSHVEFASLESLLRMNFESMADNPLIYSHVLYIAGQEVTDLVIPEGTTKICNYLFYGCTGLKSVKFPASLKAIHRGAFEGCTGLERTDFASLEGLCKMSINIGANPLIYTHTLYIAGKEVTDLVIPAGVDSVKIRTFVGSNISSVTMSDDVRYIGDDAFSGCHNLQWVKFGRGIKTIYRCFDDCPNLTRAEFADLNSVFAIQYDGQVYLGRNNPLYYAHHLFIDGKEIREITVPEGIKEIGYYALTGCESIEKVYVPEGVDHIQMGAFNGCRNLVSISLPSTLRNLGNYSMGNSGIFDFCESLSDISIAKDNPLFDSREDCNAGIYTKQNILELGGMKTVIPETVVEIGSRAFYGRTKLTSIRIPSSVVNIRVEAFGECTALRDVYYEATVVPSIFSNVFEDVPLAEATLHVPADMVEAFKQAAVWKDFGQIVPLEAIDMAVARHFIEEGKVWRVQDYEWTTGFTDRTPALGCEEFHYFDGDTVVGDQLCKKWMIRMDDHGLGIADQDMPNPMYAAAVYEEAGRVFIALPGEDRFRTLYDFTAKTGDSIDVYWKHHSHTDGGSGVSCIVGARRASESPVFKGVCTDILCCKANDPQSETTNALWMSGVGSVGIYNLEDGFWSRDHTLISCTVGDEVLYYDEALADSLYGTGAPEAKKNRLDFTHVVKSQPKAQHKAPGEAGDEVLTGTYSQYSLYVSFLPLQGAYTVTLTDADGNVVYTKDVLTDNVLALNADLAQYPEGDYSLRVENDSESYTAAFTLIGTNDISSLPSSPRGGDVLYDLQGRKILSPLPRNGETLPKGIYIRNGKKVLVK